MSKTEGQWGYLHTVLDIGFHTNLDKKEMFDRPSEAVVVLQTVSSLT